MELWIRSQNRKKLCKVTNLHIKTYMVCDNYGSYEQIAIFNDNILLGDYEEEKALKILDEIQQVILYIGLPDKELIQHFKEKCIIGNFSANSKSCIAIYEMPEENNHE